MKSKSKLVLLTVISVLLSNTLVMFLTFPVLLSYIENTFIQIQLDANKNQSEVLAKFLEENLKKGENEEELLKKFQEAIVGSQSEKGFVCVIDTNGVFLNHPNKEVIGKNVKQMNISYKSQNKGIIENWFDLLKNEYSDGGIINYETENAEIVYSVKLMNRPWKINSHENITKIKAEIQDLRFRLIIVAFIITILMAGLASFLVRKVSHKYEATIENYNIELEQKVNDLNIAKEKLEKLNTEKNNFLHIVAHDLKNPLSGILLNIELVVNYISKMTTDDLLLRLQNVTKTANYMKDIVSKLLNNELLELGDIKVASNDVNLGDFFEDVIENFKNQASKKDITIELNKHLEIDTISIDKQLLKEIIDNYVSNAIKYSPKGKTVKVNVITKQDDKQNTLDIFVEDQGEGIDESEQKLLFQKFSKVSTKPTDGEDSSGVGLYSVKRNAEAMNGEVYVKSSKGIGSTFGFTKTLL